MKILIADDEAVSRHLLEKTLTRCQLLGYRGREWRTGGGAVVSARRPPTCVTRLGHAGIVGTRRVQARSSTPRPALRLHGAAHFPRNQSRAS